MKFRHVALAGSLLLGLAMVKPAQLNAMPNVPLSSNYTAPSEIIKVTKRYKRYRRYRRYGRPYYRRHWQPRYYGYYYPRRYYYDPYYYGYRRPGVSLYFSF